MKACNMNTDDLLYCNVRTHVFISRVWLITREMNLRPDDVDQYIMQCIRDRDICNTVKRLREHISRNIPSNME